jgi:hypothetical protein
MTEQADRGRVSRKEAARQRRRDAYAKAKHARKTDPRLIALQEELKVRRREAYREMKERRKAALAELKAAKRERRANRDARAQERDDRALMRFVRPATHLE